MRERLFSRGNLCESREVKSSHFRLVQIVADYASVLLSFALGYWIYHLDSVHAAPYSLLQYLSAGVLLGFLLLLIFQYQRLYEDKVSLLHVAETRRLLIGWSLFALGLFASSFYTRWLDLSRLMVSESLVGLLLILLMERSLVYHFHLLARIRGTASSPAVIFGAGVVGRHLYKRIYHSPGLGLRVIGFLDDNSALWGQTVHIGEIRRKNGNVVLGGIEQLEKLAGERGLQEVFVAIPNASYARNLEIVQAGRNCGLTVSVVPPTYGNAMHALEVEDIGGIPILREKEARARMLYPLFKRLFDLGVSVATMILLSPLFGLISLVVKLDSPGPVLFRQKRVGLNGKEFDFFKFRTMYVDAPVYAVTPNSPDDPRITKFGRWLRRSSLDELPQFWNVLRGEMSIVGPRPEMPFIVANYTEEQRERLKVKPGITGVWQISAVRGEPIHANLEYDLFYIEHRSLLLDFIIMLKTLLTAVRGIGAV
jgi:exopolysaccharide biosynthesis polyprenyl glycosylphosphotransferase